MKKNLRKIQSEQLKTLGEKPRMSQAQVISLGFFLVILAGTLLLMLPASSRSGQPTPILDCLFTATSATCVTGLVTVDTYTHWSVFGQCVILLMIQIGGLGFMTIATFFFLLLNRKLGLREREILSESINSLQIGGILKLAKRIIAVTAFMEITGAALLMIRFCPRFGFLKGMYMGIFHSVSAFCNAGFDLMGQIDEYCSLVPYYNDLLVNTVIMLLIIIGGLGFLVWDDIINHGFRIKKYRLHSKLVLFMTSILIFSGAILFFITEKNASCKGMDVGDRLITALFGSVTARTAGFNTVDTAVMSSGGQLITIMLMFIGGSPGSTAGGIKTTTFITLMLYAFSYMRHERSFGIFGRRIEAGALRKAVVVFFTNLGMILGVTVAIAAIDGLRLADILFETTSAVGTVGLTTGITRELSRVSQMLIVFLMYCGRVGSLSFAGALAEKKAPPPIANPVERITVG